MNRVFKPLRSPSIRILALAAMISFTPGTSKADNVVFDSSNGTVTVVTDTTTGTTYAISTVADTFLDQQTTLMAMPWWGSQSLADAFVLAVGLSLGSPNGSLTPFFAYSTFTIPPYAPEVASEDVLSTLPELPGTTDVYQTDLQVYATASVIPTPEPGTLSLLFTGLLGLVLLVGVKRYRGNRLATTA